MSMICVFSKKISKMRVIFEEYPASTGCWGLLEKSCRFWYGIVENIGKGNKT